MRQQNQKLKMIKLLFSIITLIFLSCVHSFRVNTSGLDLSKWNKSDKIKCSDSSMVLYVSFGIGYNFRTVYFKNDFPRYFHSEEIYKNYPKKGIIFGNSVGMASGEIPPDSFNLAYSDSSVFRIHNFKKDTTGFYLACAECMKNGSTLLTANSSRNRYLVEIKCYRPDSFSIKNLEVIDKYVH